ncbi:MAG TPA: hypothetical protein ENG65_02520 [Candidatus Bathyarchaeota archaeon]|nr:hypothetical protein [Candidatus Bathyarchaeota archaeon]
MSTSSLDTLFATSIMICLVLFSMIGAFTAIRPLLDAPSYDWKRTDLRLAEYLLSNEGSPSDWGEGIYKTLIKFGLARRDAQRPYVLSIDKVTRLNAANRDHIDPLEAFKALNIADKPFQIVIRPLFNVTVNSVSITEGESEVTYRFKISTARFNLPVAAQIKCYAVIGDQIIECSSSTSESGVGEIKFSLTKSLSGTALLVIFAKVEPDVLSYTVYSFIHNSEGSPNEAGSYASLSPLNYTLRAYLKDPSKRILYAKVLTYNYQFNLTMIENASLTQTFIVPRILDKSVMILVGTGLDADSSEYFAEWVSYPQVPLRFGLNFTGEYHLTNAYSSRFLVTVNSATYECEVIFGG